MRWIPGTAFLILLVGCEQKTALETNNNKRETASTAAAQRQPPLPPDQGEPNRSLSSNGREVSRQQAKPLNDPLASHKNDAAPANEIILRENRKYEVRVPGKETPKNSGSRATGVVGGISGSGKRAYSVAPPPPPHAHVMRS